MRILVVEDEIRLADAIGEILKEKKYMVDIVNDGNNGYDYAMSNIYDCIILDIMLPNKNGFEICSMLRNEKINTPILMLTAKDTIADKVHGLDCGADDYMTKPFSTDELLARIRTLCRRHGEVILDEIKFSDVTFSISTCELSCQNTKKSVRLNYKEAEMIKAFLSSPSMIFSKELLITKIWGFDSDAGDNNVEAYVSFLRKKLFFIGSKIEIISLKKIGYKLEVNDG